MKELKLTNPEVFYYKNSIVEIDKGYISFLIKQSNKVSRKRSRICTHPSEDASLHEMIISHHKGIYVRPHMHIGKSESYHMIVGEMAILLFSDEGDIVKTIHLGTYESGNIFYYRANESLFHTVFILSDVAVFHEVTDGPFRREDTVFAPWSPQDHDEHSINEYLLELKKKMSQKHGHKSHLS